MRLDDRFYADFMFLPLFAVRALGAGKASHHYYLVL